MNNFKKSHDFVRQNETTVKKSQKHDVNLRKNSTLYFQIGLIVCLLSSYTALEMTFASSVDRAYVSPELTDNTIYEMVSENFKVEKKIIEKLPEPIKKAPKDPQYEAVDNDTKIDDFVEKIVEIATTDKPIKVTSANPDDFKVTPPEEMVSILAVQKVPVYKGCEKAINNNARRKCMSDKLSKLIQRKFDSDLGGELGLEGKHKIWVKFKINKQGNVEILNTKAPHLRLDKEAIRVINKVPTMTPGMNNDKPVEVSYMLPINLNIQN